MKTKVLLFAVVIFLSTSLAVRLEAQIPIWTNKAPLSGALYPLGAHFVGAATLNGRIYVVGGADYIFGYGQVSFATVSEYNPATDTWSQKADMLTNRAAPAALALNGKLYALGGQNSITNRSETTSSMEEYNPTNNTWTFRASMGETRYGHQAVALNGKIYALGGIDVNETTLASVEEYSPASNTWSNKADMPEPRSFFGAVAFNGKIYVFGGLTNWGLVAPVYSFDPVSNHWSTINSLPTPRASLGVVVVNKRILTLGGSVPNNSPTVEEYDPEADVWASKPDLDDTNRSEVYALPLGDSIYVLGGVSDLTMEATKIVPTLNCYTALELEFLTETGKVYQLQASPDLTTWTNFDSAIVGTGNYWSKIYSTRGKSQLYFRFVGTP